MSSTLGSPISVRLPKDLRDRVAALARTTRRSQGDIVREVLERDLAALEWEQRISDRAAAHRAGRATAISAEEVDQQLGLEGDPAADAIDTIS
ncbi:MULTISPECIES: ribbon-helix-helix protein, CopG family [Actinomyces]|uniref:Ribbon-helix-helix protein copg n=1 Tax=Actinomyces glycerinitolerans TaxID=1892869 RepID=A0A1M4RYY6_9ACTO|nr:MULTISPECIES: ribbon-helix-helix protein, CopG family [Actinomyces]RAX20019.1 ribbon-helix-helix protein, CopG family [Actinomyces sp. Z5]RAX22489.1 ribbon-helix-helix protein, CopG family [Actinomyces sp. Z3]SHE25139.1 ribbon-helix-helix protein copg [Actinomyces glycerinitolerans]